MFQSEREEGDYHVGDDTGVESKRKSVYDRSRGVEVLLQTEGI